MNIHTRRLPDWMKTPLPSGNDYITIKNLAAKQQLNTICLSGMIESSPLVRSFYRAERHIHA